MRICRGDCGTGHRRPECHFPVGLGSFQPDRHFPSGRHFRPAHHTGIRAFRRAGQRSLATFLFHEKAITASAARPESGGCRRRIHGTRLRGTGRFRHTGQKNTLHDRHRRTGIVERAVDPFFPYPSVRSRYRSVFRPGRSHEAGFLAVIRSSRLHSVRNSRKNTADR